MPVLPEQCGPGSRRLSESQSRVSGLLAVQRHARPIVAVQEEVRLGFVDQAALAEEVEVLRGHALGHAPAVGIQRLFPAEQPPIAHQLHAAVADPQHHLVVVAQQRNELALLPQFQQAVERSAAVGAAVDVIAQRDQRVLRCGSIAASTALSAAVQP